MKPLNKIFILVTISILFRLSFMTLPSFELDESAYRIWTQRLVSLGFSNFYSKDMFTNNPLGGLYAFWFMGLLKQILFPGIDFLSKNFDIFLKIPANVADIFSGFLIYKIIRKRINERWAIIGFLLFVFNPAIFFNSSVWGQYDGLSTVFLILGTYLLLTKEVPSLSVISFTISWAIKPQTIAFLPVVILFFLHSYSVRKNIHFLTLSFITALIIYFPFFPSNPLYGIFYVNFGSANLFNCTTCFAFNFWGIFGNWQDDRISFFYMPLIHWGILLYFLTLLIIIFRKNISKFYREPIFYLLATIYITGFFTFLTRMHERYIFSAIPFLLISFILLRSKMLGVMFFMISLLSFINLYLPYAYYNKYLNLNSTLTDFLLNNFKAFSLAFTFCFLVLLYFYHKLKITKYD